ncbi:hypothetical protein J4212_08165 [Candidatus Woesearchaeota archaeon]|nr:hypothetical protein [Candidatus Woesearchaeota archaeon]
MLDKEEFTKIRKEMDALEQEREHVIQLSRDIISLSKRIIYSINRAEMKEAASYAKEIEAKKKELDKVKVSLDVNINRVAYQEYVEAVSYYEYAAKGSIPTKAALKVETDDYLMGLCDLTGELGRKAVYEVIKGNFSEAAKIRELVDEIHGEDTIKWNLQKIEDVIFDLKMKGKLK